MIVQTTPSWMRFVLRAAGVYNVLWGLFVVFSPGALFQWAHMEAPNYPELWQCIGMIVRVYGLGYWIAATDPVRHWPIILVGFLGKLFGPIGFIRAAMQGVLPWKAGLVNITNDLIWLIPFVLILLHTYRSDRIGWRTWI